MMPNLIGKSGGAGRRLATRASRTVVPMALLTGAMLTGACYNFNISDPNGPTLGGLTQNPTAAGVAAAAVGLFAAARADMVSFIWRTESMGRDAINLSDNNQPDYAEPFFGPLSSSGFGGSVWGTEYSAIRDADILIDGAPKAHDLPAGQQALAVGYAQTEKALMLMFVVETHGYLGAPVDVDRPPDAPPAPFVTEDSVYATILHTLDSARTNLAAGAGADFPFTFPPGYANFNTPATFRQFTWALTAKALCMRATAQSETANPQPAASFYAQALHPALDSAFLSTNSADFSNGVSFDYSTGPGDVKNTLSDPLSSKTFFALPFVVSDAQTQTGGALDQRVLDKVVASADTQVIGGIPLTGTLKFTVYLQGTSVNLNAPIPVLRDEELVLLKAEAEIGTGDLASAVGDLNAVRVGSGHLPAYSGAMTVPALTVELLYNRRYSLLWEQGARWIDARRFNRFDLIEPGWNGVTGFNNPQIPHVMPIPSSECQARELGSFCNPLNTHGP